MLRGRELSVMKWRFLVAFLEVEIFQRVRVTRGLVRITLAR